MTASGVVVPVVRMRDRFRRMVEHWLPWYDEEAEAERDRRSAAIHQRSIAARINAEAARNELTRSYVAYERRLRERRAR